MQVNLGFIQQKNSSVLNTAGINSGLQEESAMTRNKDGEIVLKEQYDRVSLSPQGKMMNMIQNLMERKESIYQNRSELVTKTLEDGGTMESIETQLDLFEEQLSAVDEQISQLQTDMAKSLVEDAKESGKADSGKDKTATEQEQQEIKTLSGLANVSDSLGAAKTISAVKTKTEGEARVKESEIHMGELRIELLRNKGGGANVEDMIANAKEALDKERDKVSVLETKAEELGAVRGGVIADAAGEMQEVREGAAAPKNPEETTPPEDETEQE